MLKQSDDINDASASGINIFRFEKDTIGEVTVGIWKSSAEFC